MKFAIFFKREVPPCPGCASLEGFVEGLRTHDYTLIPIDVGETPDIGTAFGVRSVPALILVDDCEFARSGPDIIALVRSKAR